jgi:hypothetical protein
MLDRRDDVLRRVAAGRLATVFLPLGRAALAFFLPAAVALFAVFLPDDFFAAFDDDFFLVTFFRASFRFDFDFDLPALAVFLAEAFFPELRFFAAFRTVFFFEAFFLFEAFFFEALLAPDFLREPAFFFVDFFLAGARARLLDAFLATFLEVFFLVLVFLLGIRGISEWLKMQPAIIHRSPDSGSLLVGLCGDPKLRADRRDPEYSTRPSGARLPRSCRCPRER